MEINKKLFTLAHFTAFTCTKCFSPAFPGFLLPPCLLFPRLASPQLLFYFFPDLFSVCLFVCRNCCGLPHYLYLVKGRKTAAGPEPKHRYYFPPPTLPLVAVHSAVSFEFRVPFWLVAHFLHLTTIFLWNCSQIVYC